MKYHQKLALNFLWKDAKIRNVAVFRELVLASAGQTGALAAWPACPFAVLFHNSFITDPTMPPLPNLKIAGPDPVDIHVGRQLRARRMIIGWSQERLARHLGVSFQQLQKYESGMNRISASMMYRAAKAMEVLTSYFFQGLETGTQVSDDPELARLASKIAADLRRLPEPDLRRSILTLISQLANRDRRAGDDESGTSR